MPAKKTAKKVAANPKRKTGRPSKFTHELFDEICERLGKGEPLAVICRDEHMPDRSTVFDWGERDQDVSQRIARARSDGYDSIALDGLAIVDNVHEDPASRRVRSDYRLKLLSKWDPKRYGEKIDVNANISGEIRIIVGGDAV